MPRFRYTTGVQAFPWFSHPDDCDALAGCDCGSADACGTSTSCTCAQTNRAAGDPLLRTFACHGDCACRPGCALRWTEQRCRVPLRGVHMGRKGWGVTAGARIGAGVFVACYAGDALSDARLVALRPAYDAAALSYVLTAAEHFGGGGAARRTHVDATRRGNVARLFNHSCAPTLELRAVHAGSMAPALAFFARRDVRAGEELTFSYGGDGGGGGGAGGGGGTRACLCGAEHCVGRLPCASDAP
ncbi:hypothetical protein JKP88DRAFT_308674 [Tribonema minus]|uniref:SET domain-containing protein n=1 Tax=Tribonema minus TaxID=303371 RepID=A0A835Z5M6_9STRA|nr:hypothetical protein JKP88DRAFT_308674 [Tribonema minus]